MFEIQDTPHSRLRRSISVAMEGSCGAARLESKRRGFVVSKCDLGGMGYRSFTHRAGWQQLL
jgi:hypothetical protein